MEVNNNGENNQVIYPQNIKKYSGRIQTIWSESKFGRNRIVSFMVRIRVANFKYNRNFKSRDEAEAELIRLNHENKLDIKNVIIDRGDHYFVKLNGNKNFLADKIDLPFIEAYIWSSTNNNYAITNQNGRQIKFHNLILGHTPIMNSSVDHINRNPLDNRRVNLRIATNQTQLINRNPQNMVNRTGVSSDKNRWYVNWVDKRGIKKIVAFSINKLGYEVAKQLAIAKRLEIELTLNHYHLALHNLPPLEPEEPEVNYDFEEPDDEPDEI